MIGRIPVLRVLCVLALLVAASAARAPHVRADYVPSADLPSAEWRGPDRPGVVALVMHGGGWYGNDPRYVRDMRSYARALRRGGLVATNNIDYNAGHYSLPDVVTAFDRARRRFPGLPVCAVGHSAGGNLALLLAKQRPVDCVIAEAAPTDIASASETIRNTAAFLFGVEAFAVWSPLLVTGAIRVPTLLVSARNDPIVPHSQATAFKRRYPCSGLVTLAPGAAQFVHSPVSRRQLEAARGRETALLARIAARRGDGSAPRLRCQP